MHAELGNALLLKGDAQGALAEIEQETSEVWKTIGLSMAYHALGRKADSDAAVAALSQPDGERRIVLGPASDGGFYLVAARRAWPEAFAGVSWSLNTVLAQTESRARAAGLDVVRVEPCDDVDVMDDLDRVLRTQSADRAPRTRAWARSRD